MSYSKTVLSVPTNTGREPTGFISRRPVRLSLPVTNDGCPISARFWQMWDSTALDRQLSLLQRIPRSMIIYTLYSQRSRSVESHICQNRADMGHPSFVTGRERHFLRPNSGI